MNHLPSLNQPASQTKPADNSIHFSPILAEAAQLEKDAVFTRMKTAPEGLNENEAGKRLAENGPNVVAESKHRGWPRRAIRSSSCSPCLRRFPLPLAMRVPGR